MLEIDSKSVFHTFVSKKLLLHVKFRKIHDISLIPEILPEIISIS